MTELWTIALAALVIACFALPSLLILANECSKLHKQNAALRDRNTAQALTISKFELRQAAQRENEVSRINEPKDDLRAVEGVGGQIGGMSFFNPAHIAPEMEQILAQGNLHGPIFHVPARDRQTYYGEEAEQIAARAAGEGEPWPIRPA